MEEKRNVFSLSLSLTLTADSAKKKKVMMRSRHVRHVDGGWKPDRLGWLITAPQEVGGWLWWWWWEGDEGVLE